MSEHPDARRTVSADDIGSLAELYDRFKYADDPGSTQCREAEIAYDQRVRELYEQCVEPYYKSISFFQFRGRIDAECARQIKSNQ